MVTRAGRKFNWVDVTLETYDVTDCAQFASGPVSFYDMKLVVRHGDLSFVRDHTPLGFFTRVFFSFLVRVRS